MRTPAWSYLLKIVAKGCRCLWEERFIDCHSARCLRDRRLKPPPWPRNHSPESPLLRLLTSRGNGARRTTASGLSCCISGRHQA